MSHVNLFAALERLWISSSFPTLFCVAPFHQNKHLSISKDQRKTSSYSFLTITASLFIIYGLSSTRSTRGFFHVVDCNQYLGLVSIFADNDKTDDFADQLHTVEDLINNSSDCHETREIYVEIAANVRLAAW